MIIVSLCAGGPIKVLNLGAGVQSSTILLMICEGRLPRVDAVVFADTGWESKAVYSNLEWLRGQAEAAAIPLHVVSVGRKIHEDAMSSQVRGCTKDGTRWASMPMVTILADGSKGMLRRQCTTEYKIRPIERFIRREMLGLRKRQRAPLVSVDQWFGISADEIRRVRMSKGGWVRNVYPLLNLPEKMIDRPHTRLMCREWLAEHFPGREFPRSACIGCPFKSDREWRKTKSEPDEWASAVEVDEKIRNCGGMRGKTYLHGRGVPLRTAWLDEDQREIEWGDECLGICGV